MKHFYVLLTVILFILQGCATKEATPELNQRQVKVETTTSDTSQKATPDEKQTENNMEEFEEEFSEQETNDIIDPLSGYNRAMTSLMILL